MKVKIQLISISLVDCASTSTSTFLNQSNSVIYPSTVLNLRCLSSLAFMYY